MEKKPLRLAKTKVFGATPVNTLVASGADLSDQLKVVFRMPKDEESTLGDVVQLIRPQPSYVEGHYYQYREVDGVSQWVDISSSIPHGNQYGNGFYAFVGYRLFLVWADPPGVSGEYEWSKSEVYIRDVKQNGRSAGERRLLVSSEINAYAKDANAIHVNMGYDAESDFNPETQQIILRTYFTDVRSQDTDYTESYIVPFTIDQSSLLAFQSDWEETDPKSAGYIRNKPIIPTEFFVDENGDLSYKYLLNGEEFTQSIGHVKDVTGFFVENNIVHIREGLENGYGADGGEGPGAVQFGMLGTPISNTLDDDGYVDETTWHLELKNDHHVEVEDPDAEPEPGPAEYFRANYYVTYFFEADGRRYVEVGIVTDVLNGTDIVINHSQLSKEMKKALTRSFGYELPDEEPLGVSRENTPLRAAMAPPEVTCYIALGRAVTASADPEYNNWNYPIDAADLYQMTKFGTAFGAHTFAHGNGALAAGAHTVVMADMATAIGYGLYNLQPGTTVVGAFNEIIKPDGTHFGDTVDGINKHIKSPFVVGIGTADNARKDGFRVNMDGSVFIRNIFDKIGLLNPYASRKMLLESYNKMLAELGAIDKNSVAYVNPYGSGDISDDTISGITVGIVPTETFLPNGEIVNEEKEVAIAIGPQSNNWHCFTAEGAKFIRTNPEVAGKSQFPVTYVPEYKTFFVSYQNYIGATHGIPDNREDYAHVTTNGFDNVITVCSHSQLFNGTKFLMIGPDIVSPSMVNGKITLTKITGVKQDGSAFGPTSHEVSECMDVNGSPVLVTSINEIHDGAKCVLYYSQADIDNVDGTPIVRYNPCNFVIPMAIGPSAEEPSETTPAEFTVSGLTVVTDTNGRQVMLASFDIVNDVESINDAYVLYSLDGITWKTMPNLPRGLYNKPVALGDGKVLIPSLKGTGMWYTENLWVTNDGTQIDATWKQVPGVTTGNWMYPTKLKLSEDLSVYVTAMDLWDHTLNNSCAVYEPSRLIVSEDGINWFWTELDGIDLAQPAVAGNNVLIPTNNLSIHDDPIIVFSIEEFTDLVKRALDLGKDSTRIIIEHFDKNDRTKTWKDLTDAFNKLVDAHNQLARSV